MIRVFIVRYGLPPSGETICSVGAVTSGPGGIGFVLLPGSLPLAGAPGLPGATPPGLPPLKGGAGGIPPLAGGAGLLPPPGLLPLLGGVMPPPGFPLLGGGVPIVPGVPPLGGGVPIVPGVPPLGGGVPIVPGVPPLVGPTILHVNNWVAETPAAFVAATVT